MNTPITDSQYFLAEDPTNDEHGQFVVNPIMGMAWHVHVTTELNDIIGTNFAASWVHVNPDGVVEWIGLSQMSDEGDVRRANEALDWYVKYLRWQYQDQEVKFKPFRDGMDRVFAFQANHAPPRFGILHDGMVEVFTQHPHFVDRLQELDPLKRIAEGSIPGIPWPVASLAS